MAAGMQASGFASAGAAPSGALLAASLAPPSPQALSGMNPSQIILSQPSGAAAYQALQLPSQPDVQSALAADAPDGGARKPQVAGALTPERAAALGIGVVQAWISQSLPGMHRLQAASDAEHLLTEANASPDNKIGAVCRQYEDSISMRGRWQQSSI